METITPNPMVHFLPLIIMIIPSAIIVNRLAKEKVKKVVLWTILACIPFVNFFCVFYIVGTANNKQNEKLDKILEALNNLESKNRV
ncbi:hypothetical protein E9993_13670 [Labilibacter sediminis]|nr:hypothetical protein E9993_13670 [Labilibacter sediminis]